MLLYNITFHVEHVAVSGFMQYLDEIHLPEMEKAGYLHSHQIFRILHQDESEVLTFALQYFFSDAGTYHQHLSVMDGVLKKELFEQFGEKVLYFCTTMEKL